MPFRSLKNTFDSRSDLSLSGGCLLSVLEDWDHHFRKTENVQAEALPSITNEKFD